MTTPTPAELISRYEALPPLEKNVFRLLCLNITTMTQNDLLFGLHFLQSGSPGLTWDGVTKKEISAILHKLEAAGLTVAKIQSPAGRPPLLRNHVLLDVLDHGLFAQIHACLNAGSKKDQRSYGYGRIFSTPGAGLRVLLGQLFGKSSMTEMNKTFIALQRDFGHILDDSPLTTLFGPTIPMPLLRHCTHRQNIALYLFNQAFNTLQPDPELVAMLLEDIRAGSKIISPFWPMLYLLFRGEMDLVMEVLALSWPDNSSLEKKCAQAILHFVQGRYEAVNQTFAEILAEIKKSTGKRKVAIPELAGIIHLCSLLAIGGARNLELGKDLLEIAKKQQLFPSEVQHNLKVVFAQQIGRPHEKGLWSPRALAAYPVYRFLYFLSLWWADREQALSVLPKICETLQFDAMEHGFFWLAAECSALLAALGRERSDNKNLAEEFHKSCQTISCVDIIQPKNQDMQRLQSLLALAAAREQQKEGAETEPRDQRLAWLFSHYPKNNSCSLSPILQKISKTGKWSNGRNVSLKTLHEQNESMEGLTNQDRLICRCLTRDYGYHSYNYQFDMDKALVAVVGHPLLFLKNNPEAPVELGRGELELRISKNDASISLSLWPEPPTNAGTVFLHRESATSFKVYQLNPAQANLLALLREKLDLPLDTTEQVRELASSLSSVVTVHSDVGGGLEAMEVVADHLPHLHLLPFQDGLRAELSVRPLGPGGPWLQPGQGGAIVLGELDGKRVQCKRDLTKEASHCGKLMTACPAMSHAQEVDGQFLFPEPAESLELICQLQAFPDCTTHWPRGQRFSLRAEADFANLSLRIGKNRDWFAASGSLRVDKETVLDLQQLLAMLDQGKDRFIPLKDGSFLALTSALRKRLDELRVYSEKNKEGVRFSPLAALALDELTSSVEVDGDKQWQAHKARLAKVARFSLPSTLTASLRDYQVQGFSWLAQLSHWRMGACLADDMGLGKTIQALAAILLLAPKGPTLVVAPLSVAGNWAEEAARFAPTLRIKPFGQGDRQEMLDGLGPFDLLICSYGLLQVEGGRLAGVAWQTVILDEAQAIKNRQTKRAKAAMALNAAFRMVTTGTPLENHLGELWTLFHFLNPGLLGSHQRFTETFAVPIEHDKDRKRLEQLQRLIRPFILRRMKHEVLQELPAKTEITLQVEMSEPEAALYEAQRRTALDRLEAGAGQPEGRHLQILAEIMKLRRLCCNPALVLPEAGIASSKLKVFGDIMEELLENKHKALVFSQFIDHLAIIRAFLEEKKIPCQYLDGATPAAHRKERIARFQAGEGEVFLISLKAGGAGLNLTAADYVVHMDPWWNPAVEDQASDRVHRIGQERPVTVYRLVMKDSIEEQIVALHKDKRDLADSLLDGAGAAGKLNADELLSLIRGNTKSCGA